MNIFKIIHFFITLVNALSNVLQKTAEKELDTIADLILKYELKADRNCHKKAEIWAKIHTDFCKALNVDKKVKTVKMIQNQWNNKISTLRTMGKKVDSEKHATGNNYFLYTQNSI